MSCVPDPALVAERKSWRAVFHRGRMDDHLYKRSVLLIEKIVRPIIPLLTVRNMDPYEVKRWRRAKRTWEGLRDQYAKLGMKDRTQTLRDMGNCLAEEEAREVVPSYDEAGFGSPFVPQHLLESFNAVPPPQFPVVTRRNRIQYHQHGPRRSGMCGPCGWVFLARTGRAGGPRITVRCPRCGAVS